MNKSYFVFKIFYNYQNKCCDFSKKIDVKVNWNNNILIVIYFEEQNEIYKNYKIIVLIIVVVHSISILPIIKGANTNDNLKCYDRN